MACNGHTNSCGGHGAYEPAVSETSWTDDPVSTATKVKVVHHNELRSSIDAELTRWSASWPTDPGAVTTSTKIQNEHVKNLRDGIDTCQSWSWPSQLDDAELEDRDVIKASQYNSLRDQVNTIELTCACDCAYACTCDCNYCTCDCNYCTCNCNYACTCDCAYSDKRLKTEIEYM